MKKTVVCLILLACVLYCIGSYLYHSIPYQFEIEGAHTMKIFSGSTGENIEVTNPDVIARITEEINLREFTRGSKETIDGYSYAIAWYGEDGETIEILYLLGGGSTVIKAKTRRHYDLPEDFAPIELADIEALFETTP